MFYLSGAAPYKKSGTMPYMVYPPKMADRFHTQGPTRRVVLGWCPPYKQHPTGNLAQPLISAKSHAGPVEVVVVVA